MFTSENVLCRKRQLQLTAPYTPSPLRETSIQNFNKCATIFCCQCLIIFLLIVSF